MLVQSNVSYRQWLFFEFELECECICTPTTASANSVYRTAAMWLYWTKKPVIL